MLLAVPRSATMPSIRLHLARLQPRRVPADHVSGTQSMMSHHITQLEVADVHGRLMGDHRAIAARAAASIAASAAIWQVGGSSASRVESDAGSHFSANN